MVSFERVFEVLDLPIEITDPENPIEPEEIRGDVRFENVSFTYSVLPGQVVVKLEEQKRYGQQVCHFFVCHLSVLREYDIHLFLSPRMLKSLTISLSLSFSLLSHFSGQLGIGEVGWENHMTRQKRVKCVGYFGNRLLFLKSLGNNVFCFKTFVSYNPLKFQY